MPDVELTGFDLTIEQVVTIATGKAGFNLAPATAERIRAGRAIVEQAVQDGEPVYGVNTGVGAQKTETVSETEIASFNSKLLTAHSTHPPGALMEKTAVRAAMVVLINQLASGASGVRPALIDMLIKALREDRIPSVTAEGSLSASDILPLSQLAMGVIADADPPFEPAAKESVALMNSNAMSLGPGALLLEDIARLLVAYDLSAALALEGFRGNPSIVSSASIDSLARAGRDGAARRIGAFLDGSRLWEKDEPRFIQDPLSFRCIPAIHGTSLRAFDQIHRNWSLELNVTNDNPMMDLETGRPVSHGNMESGAETLDLDILRLVLAKLAAVSGERQHKLMWPSFTGLPSGLADAEAGAASGAGFLGLDAISAASIARIQLNAQPAYLAMPGQVSDGVEDVSGFAMLAMAQTEKVVADTWTIVAMEMAISVWAIRRRTIASSNLSKACALVVDRLSSLLPMQREGHERFDTRPLIALVRTPGLLEEAMEAAGLDRRRQDGH